MKMFHAVLVLASALSLAAAERAFDFSDVKTGTAPTGWEGFVTGDPSHPGDWQIVQDEVPSAFAPLTAGAPQTSRRAVLAQLSKLPTDERFPVLAFAGERFGDFTATVRFKLVEGTMEQIAGLAFRIVDPGNFYVVRASGLGKNVRFYKFVQGDRSAPIGPEIPIQRNRWYELGVKAEANRIQVSLDGKNILPELTDNSHLAGRIGLVTKSDTVAYFRDLHIQYKPLETLAASLVREVLEKQPRLLDVQILGITPDQPELHVMGAKNPASIGRLANDAEKRVFAEGHANCNRGGTTNVVNHPLYDRNGDPVGVVHFGIKPYPGQLEDALITKSIPWAQSMNQRIGASKDLTE